jgi:hypothetical protein
MGSRNASVSAFCHNHQCISKRVVAWHRRPSSSCICSRPAQINSPVIVSLPPAYMQTARCNSSWFRNGCMIPSPWNSLGPYRSVLGYLLLIWNFGSPNSCTSWWSLIIFLLSWLQASDTQVSSLWRNCGIPHIPFVQEACPYLIHKFLCLLPE